MKRIICILICLSASFECFAQSAVNFEEIPLQEALAKAKRENKLVFMDGSSTGCSYCRKMENEVFSLKSVGQYLNKDFVCVKYNMLKGEGPELRKKYAVNKFPTFLILTTDGEILHKFIGYREEKAFLQEMEMRFDKKHSYRALKTRYESRERNVELLNEYAEILLRSQDWSVREVLVDLASLLSDSEKVSEKYWHLFSEPLTASWVTPNIIYLINNYDRFCLSLGEEKVEAALLQKFDGEISNILYHYKTKEASENDTSIRLDKLKQEIVLLPESLQDYARLKVLLCRQLAKEDFAGIIKTCKEKLGKLSERQIEQVYSNVHGRIFTYFSPEQKQEWLTFGGKLVANMNDKALRQKMERFTKMNLKH